MARAQQHSVSVEGTDIRFTVKPGETILRAAARHKVSFPSLCNVGECGSCRCRLKKGQVRLKSDVSRHVDDAALARGDILACQSKLMSSIDLHVPTLSPANSERGEEAEKIAATIASVIPLSADIVELTLALDKPLTYRAGQFVLLFVPSQPALATEPRSYSLAKGAKTSGVKTVQFHIRKVPGGLFTQWLFGGDRTGELLLLEGPFGSFTWADDERDVVLIAGGSGYAPINALLEAARNLGPLSATVFFGAKTQADLYCSEHVAAVQAAWQGSLQFVPVLSAEPADSQWQGLRGYVQEHIDKPATKPTASSAYLCGPPPMIDACLEVLRDYIEPQNTHYDKFLNRSHMSKEQLDDS